MTFIPHLNIAVVAIIYLMHNQSDWRVHDWIYSIVIVRSRTPHVHDSDPTRASYRTAFKTSSSDGPIKQRRVADEEEGNLRNQSQDQPLEIIREIQSDGR